MAFDSCCILLYSNISSVFEAWLEDYQRFLADDIPFFMLIRISVFLACCCSTNLCFSASQAFLKAKSSAFLLAMASARSCASIVC